MKMLTLNTGSKSIDESFPTAYAVGSGSYAAPRLLQREPLIVACDTSTKKGPDLPDARVNGESSNGGFFVFFDQVWCNRYGRCVCVFGQNRVDDRKAERMFAGDPRHRFALGIDGVAPVLLVPVGQTRGLVHVLYD